VHALSLQTEVFQGNLGNTEHVILLHYPECFAVLHHCLVQHTVQAKTRMSSLLKTAQKMIVKLTIKTFLDCYHTNMLRTANKISEPSSPVLNSEFVLLPSRKRYRLPLCKLVRHKNEFVPHALTLMNK
jgi:hypothetical protein